MTIISHHKKSVAEKKKLKNHAQLKTLTKTSNDKRQALRY